MDESERIFSAREPRSWVDKPLIGGFRKARMDTGKSAYQPGRVPVTSNQPRTPVEYPPNPLLSELLQKLQDKALQRSLRLSEFFKEFDKHGQQSHHPRAPSKAERASLAVLLILAFLLAL